MSWRRVRIRDLGVKVSVNKKDIKWACWEEFKVVKKVDSISDATKKSDEEDAIFTELALLRMFPFLSNF